jgi:hypothetical protein
MNDEEDAYETYQAYQERRRQPMQVWSPKLTEQQKQDLEKYIEEHNLPF